MHEKLQRNDGPDKFAEGAAQNTCGIHEAVREAYQSSASKMSWGAADKSAAKSADSCTNGHLEFSNLWGEKETKKEGDHCHRARHHHDIATPPASTPTGDSTTPPASTPTGDSTTPPASTPTGDSTTYPAIPTTLARDLGSISLSGDGSATIAALQKLGTVSQNADGSLVLDANGKQLPELDLMNVSNLTIENAIFGPGDNRGVYINGGSNVTVKNSAFIETGAGVFTEGSNSTTIDGNYFQNMQGMSSRAAAIQFAHQTGTNSVDNNTIINQPGHSMLEDAINVWASGGTYDISGNSITGGGGSSSGAAITAGDTNQLNPDYNPASNNADSIGSYTINNNTVNEAYGTQAVGFGFVGGNIEASGNMVTLDSADGGRSLQVYEYRQSTLGTLNIHNNEFLGPNPEYIQAGIPAITGLNTNATGA